MTILDGILVTPIGNAEPASVWVDCCQHPRLQPQFVCRNGQIPSASFQGDLVRLANQISRYRSKELFASPGQVAAIPNSGSTNRFRFAAHTSPMVRTIVARVILAGTTNGATPFDPFTRLTIQDASGNTLGFGDYHFGAMLKVLDTPSEWSVGTIAIDASGFKDTDIRGLFTDNGQSRIVSATVYEISEYSELQYGYLPQNYAIGSGIYDIDRSGPEEMAARLWKRGAAPLIPFSSSTDATAPSTGSIIAVNLFDQSSTTNTPNTPGFTVDLRYCSRQNAPTLVPCRFEAYFGTNGANPCTVTLVDATGATLATLTGSGANAWYQGTVNLPATLQKIDVMFTSFIASTLTVYAVNVYQYQA